MNPFLFLIPPPEGPPFFSLWTEDALLVVKTPRFPPLVAAVTASKHDGADTWQSNERLVVYPVVNSLVYKPPATSYQNIPQLLSLVFHYCNYACNYVESLDGQIQGRLTGSMFNSLRNLYYTINNLWSIFASQDEDLTTIHILEIHFCSGWRKRLL